MHNEQLGRHYTWYWGYRNEYDIALVILVTIFLAIESFQNILKDSMLVISSEVSRIWWILLCICTTKEPIKEKFWLSKKNSMSDWECFQRKTQTTMAYTRPGTPPGSRSSKTSRPFPHVGTVAAAAQPSGQQKEKTTRKMPWHLYQESETLSLIPREFLFTMARTVSHGHL